MVNALPQLENTFAELGNNFVAPARAAIFENPSIIRINKKLSEELSLDLSKIDEVVLARLFSGNLPFPNSKTVAMAYAGHQFGHLSILGDGRALLLGEIIGKDGLRYDMHLKGSGPTQYSRGGDGFAGLGSVIREYIMSHAMKCLGVPTTQSLAIVSSGDEILREDYQKGAILVRIAQSHIRVGTFTLFAAKAMHEEIRILADYAIDRHYPYLVSAPNKYFEFLKAVMGRQALLIAKWMGIGFIHGVMNTDNMAISGETIDYGPCAFMDFYNPNQVYSSIDRHERYRYNNQPNIAIWNLARLAESLLTLLSDDENQALELAQNAINSFGETYKAEWLGVMRAKFGLATQLDEDEALINEFLVLLAQGHFDFTNSFHGLCSFEMPNQNAFNDWNTKWQNRISLESYSADEARKIMRANNPSIIPRNHQVQKAIAAGENGDFEPMDKLLSALSRPFDETQEFAEFKAPPNPEEEVKKTFCGT